MNLVLFMGAGFSKPFGYPVMNEFTTYAERGSRLTTQDKEFLKTLILETRKAYSILQGSFSNLEDILSFSMMVDRLGLQDNRNSAIRRMLQKIYTQIPNENLYWRMSEVFKKFLEYDKQWFDKLTIVTTNYDLNIECSLLFLRLYSNPGFEYSRVPDSKELGGLYAKDGIAVLKLHGSVNWYESTKDPETFEVDDTTDPELEIIHSGFYLPKIYLRDKITEKVPFIIPPSYIKPDFRGPLGKIWGQAATAIQHAHMVAFVGYSFPSSDTEMKYFLASSLLDNPRIEKIVVIDPIAAQIVDRLKEKGSKYGDFFKTRLQPLINEWDKISPLRNFISY